MDLQLYHALFSHGFLRINVDCFGALLIRFTGLTINAEKPFNSHPNLGYPDNVHQWIDNGIQYQEHQRKHA